MKKLNKTDFAKFIYENGQIKNKISFEVFIRDYETTIENNYEKYLNMYYENLEK